ncbi:MAG: hypothetical protein H8D34_10580 [Chloroflexi bacterium]|nr:hypothetical protein [Chloroflexota bacterium]
MEKTTTRPAIPTETAIELCALIREEIRQEWHAESARWCWLCEQEHAVKPEKMGFIKRPGNRGCPQINARYAREFLTN